MSFHPSLFGSAQLPDFVDGRPPRHRPDGARRPTPASGGALVTVFETPGPVALRLTLAGGKVYVETSDDRTVEIELVPLRDNDITRQAIAEARVEMTDRGGGHEIVVQVPKKPGFLVGRDAKVGIRVRCPHGSGLGIRAPARRVSTQRACSAQSTSRRHPATFPWRMLRPWT